ncbi:MAG TPA: DUF5947 family protein [Actinophytocola sp.]|uniref:DUF5947 family protein n=1 Tax=Actinophytocola sp. TaxID=1872138 RepID=UPI002DB7B0C7|nr:DUF5947 family protein [Actinophytocola sp.]HEU5471487.1 DUF5947 family protein [Actinophytocola sp.]
MNQRGGLRRFRAPAPAPEPAPPEVERCELCGTLVDPGHGHVVDLEHRSIMCACRACYLLFTRPEAGRYRAVPDRYLHDPARQLTTAEWEGLGIPVGAVFFLRGADGLAAFYPSPAGATECLLNLETWTELAANHPLLGMVEPEVEAILIRAEQAGVECYLVPIDACYQLVGLVRLHWTGFDGGPEAREAIAGFFAELRSRVRPLEPEG